MKHLDKDTTIEKTFIFKYVKKRKYKTQKAIFTFKKHSDNALKDSNHYYAIHLELFNDKNVLESCFPLTSNQLEVMYNKIIQDIFKFRDMKYEMVNKISNLNSPNDFIFRSISNIKLDNNIIINSINVQWRKVRHLYKKILVDSLRNQI